MQRMLRKQGMQRKHIMRSSASKGSSCSEFCVRCVRHRQEHGRLCLFGASSCVVQKAVYLFAGARFCVKAHGPNWVREADESSDLLAFNTGIHSSKLTSLCCHFLHHFFKRPLPLSRSPFFLQLSKSQVSFLIHLSLKSSFWVSSN